MGGSAPGRDAAGLGGRTVRMAGNTPRGEWRAPGSNRGAFGWGPGRYGTPGESQRCEFGRLGKERAGTLG